MKGIVVFSGSAHHALADEICDHLEVPRSHVKISRFSNDCLQAQLLANCRQRDVYIVQPLVPPTQEHLMELLLMVNAARGASAAQITAVIPHYAYARSDKKDASRISLGGRLVDHYRGRDLSNHVVVSPDLGNAKQATLLARLLGLPVAAGNKQRLADDKVVISSVVGDVAGKKAIVLDDEIATGGSIIEIVSRLADFGCAEASIACTHGLFAGSAVERLTSATHISEVVSTNTVPAPENFPGLKVLSVASLFAEAIARIHSGNSVSTLFNGVDPAYAQPQEPEGLF